MSKLNPKTVRDWIGFLQSKVIQYDKRYNRNPNAMAHYANALSKIEADVKPILGSSDSEALNALVRPMNKRFLPDSSTARQEHQEDPLRPSPR